MTLGLYIFVVGIYMLIILSVFGFEGAFDHGTDKLFYRMEITMEYFKYSSYRDLVYQWFDWWLDFLKYNDVYIL